MIVRIQKLDRDFTTVSNGFLRDTRIGWSAKGIITYLLSKPTDWKVRVADLVEQGPDGEQKVQTALNQLREFGYAKLATVRVKGRVAGTEWIIYEAPTEKAENGLSVEAPTDKPFFPDSEKPRLGKAARLVSTDINQILIRPNTECGDAREKKSPQKRKSGLSENSPTPNGNEKQNNFKGRGAKTETASGGSRISDHNEKAFAETQYDKDYSLFETDINLRAELPETVSLTYYYNLVKNWSASKGITRTDWIAQTLYFINQDSSNGKLKLTTQTPNTGDAKTDRAIASIERAKRLASKS